MEYVGNANFDETGIMHLYARGNIGKHDVSRPTEIILKKAGNLLVVECRFAQRNPETIVLAPVGKAHFALEA